MLPLTSYPHDFLWWTITETVRLIGDRVHLQLVPAPSTGNGWRATGTVEGPFFRESGSKRHQVRPVTEWTETNQISSEALRALGAMANTRFHAALFGPPRLPRGTVDPFTQRVETVVKSHGRLSVPVIQPRSLMPLAPPEVSADVNILLDCVLHPCPPELAYAVIVPD